MKKPVTIQLKLAEIIYDIQNKTYLTGRSLQNGSNHSHVANMQANDDDENSAQILRSITSAYAVLRNRLAEYLDSEESITTNDSLTLEDSLSLSLNMPSNFNANVTKSIGEVIHQFIVAYSVADWFVITAKGETGDYTKEADAALDILEQILCKRSRPLRATK